MNTNFLGTGRMAAATLLAATLAITMVAHAQPPASEKPDDKKIMAVVQEVMVGAKQAELAKALVEYGRQTRNALALINAVQMFDAIPAKVLPPGESGAGGKAYERSALLAEAKSYAGEQAELKELIKDVEATQAKGYYMPSCYYDWVCGPYGCFYRWVCY